MESWEYCIALVFSVGATNSHLGLRICYYSADGNHRTEEVILDPRPKTTADNWHRVLGTALALLGLQGWELVTVGGGGGWSAVLKRRVAQPPSG